MRPLLLLACLAPAPAVALDYCDEIWFTRNLIFDQAGYCFGSPLGQAIFDNADCTPGAVTLAPQQQAMVDTLIAEADYWECKTDTSGLRLNIAQPELRRRMQQMPIPTPYESACIGYRGAPIALHSGRNEAAPVTGQIATGEMIVWSFEAVEGWQFLVSPSGQGMGWMRDHAWTEAECESFAG